MKYTFRMSDSTNSLAVAMSILMTCLMAISCSPKHSISPDGPHWRDNDNRDIPDPGKRKPILEWEFVERTTFKQAEQLLDFDRSLGKITGHRKQAVNINSFDEVPDCAWFTNRHFFKPLSASEISDGVARNSAAGPDTSEVWTVFRPKVMGQTPGIWIKDRRGDTYILKFDPVGYPEMATGAAAMASRFFHAVGYNVPQETISYIHTDKLIIKEGLRFTDRIGRKRMFTQADLDELLARVNVQPDGRIRVLASLLLPNVRGPFSFDGRRGSDPNDWCDHEDRRELRALYVFCSFANHWDIKDQNTLDVYADENGRRYLKHYLIDFGSTFGSGGHSPQDPKMGYANLFDLKDALVSLVTLGLKKWQWEDAGEIEYPSIGYFESEIFNPSKWKPIYPIPAFEEMTDRDAYWAAKIVMSMRDDDLRALIKAGLYSDSSAVEYMFQTLKQRRDKIGEHWFSKVNPLDKFELSQSANGLTISFVDLAAEYELTNSATAHSYYVECDGKRVIDEQTTKSNEIRLDSNQVVALVSAYRSKSSPHESYLCRVTVHSLRSDGKRSKPTLLYLRCSPENDNFKLVGIEHAD